MGIEPATSSLPRKCSTPELRRLFTKSSLVRGCGFCDRAHPGFAMDRQPFQWLPFERETGLEPATYSLEGYRSTK